MTTTYTMNNITPLPHLWASAHRKVCRCWRWSMAGNHEEQGVTNVGNNKHGKQQMQGTTNMGNDKCREQQTAGTRPMSDRWQPGGNNECRKQQTMGNRSDQQWGTTNTGNNQHREWQMQRTTNNGEWEWPIMGNDQCGEWQTDDNWGGMMNAGNNEQCGMEMTNNRDQPMQGLVLPLAKPLVSNNLAIASGIEFLKFLKYFT